MKMSETYLDNVSSDGNAGTQKLSSKLEQKQNEVVDEIAKSVAEDKLKPTGTEEGYGTDDEGIGDKTDGYKSVLAGAPSYHSYLTLLPDYDDGKDEPLSSPDSAPLYDNSGANTPSDLPSPTSSVEIEQNEAEREKLMNELTEVESDVLALRQTLRAKEMRAKEIRRKLGLTPIHRLKEDVSVGWNKLQTSTAYNKTKTGLSTAGQKTSAAFSTFGSAVTRKLGEVRESNAFKSFEEKVSTAALNVKSKVGRQQSQDSSFEDVMQSTANAEAQNDSTGGQKTSDPPLPEEKVPL